VQMYVHDISSIVWEILRPAAVQGGDHQFGLHLLVQLRGPGQSEYYVKDKAQALAHAWFPDQEAKKQVFRNTQSI